MNALLGVFVITAIFFVGFLIILVKDVFSKNGIDLTVGRQEEIEKYKEEKLAEAQKVYKDTLKVLDLRHGAADEEILQIKKEYAKKIMEEYKEDPNSLAEKFEKEFGIKVKK